MNVGFLRQLAGLAAIEGRHVRLEELTAAHADPLSEIGLEDEIWRWMQAPVRTPDQMRAWVDAALALRDAGTAFPFAVVHRASNRIAGSTRFGNIEAAHRRLEIGWTWYGREFQRTAVNTETKYLLLRTAFEELDCVRVEFKTDALNERSRAALLRIGAREEGILRSHFIVHGGRRRDSVYFSILDSEWPGVRSALEQKLGERIAGAMP